MIGRNGKGKSTLLRWLAARRVGGLPDDLSVHYVSQEVTLTEEEENSTPIAVVLAADVERTMLLEEVRLPFTPVFLPLKAVILLDLLGLLDFWLNFGRFWHRSLRLRTIQEESTALRSMRNGSEWCDFC